MSVRPLLSERLPAHPGASAEELLDRFVTWAADAGFTLYAHQEEALLEVFSGKHVILNTPTGSGKSMVALGMHFKALAEGRISFYTSPIKALASEKFFALCDDFGAANVGMLTGDASINPQAKILCCTSEVLANMALRSGDQLDAPYAVLDEFHYYSDSERGWAWQVPLITLPKTRFLLMSATLGDMTPIAERLERATGVPVANVTSAVRPVPLDFEYQETPLHETIETLLELQRAPVYVVNFTQRECAELAQSLTSMGMTSRDEREAIRAELGDFRFDTPYGKEIRRFLTFGIGVHHAGLLPKYRLLVEQLSQKGMLKVICGTDTLGVGVNIPIRTVVFSKLAKYDGEKVQILSVRDFKQIAGRAGRKGFDDRGWVVAQAPEEAIERKRAAAKGKKGKKGPTPSQPQRAALKGARGPRGSGKGEVTWTKETFERLIQKAPETLKSRFRITHGMVLNLLQRDEEANDPNRKNFASLRELIAGSHEEDSAKKRHLKHAAVLVRSLVRARILVLQRDSRTPYYWVIVNPDLQFDFSLYHALSLFLVEMVPLLEAEHPTYVGDLLTLVESVLENPEIVLRKQTDRAKQAALAEMKSQGVQYEERMEKLEGISYPKPLAEWLFGNFDRFARMHPWVGDREIEPKSIGREMWENYASFNDYVKAYGLERSEGVLLRYLSQLYRTLQQNVPIVAKTEAVEDVLGFFRTTIELTDTSLLEEWESMLHPELLLRKREEREKAVEAIWVRELVENPKVFAARVRSEMHLFVHALAGRNWEEAAERIAHELRPADGEPAAGEWDAGRLEAALAPFFEEYTDLITSPESRRHHWTQIRPVGDKQWEVQQTLMDPLLDNFWGIRARVDLRRATSVEIPLLRIESIAK